MADMMMRRVPADYGNWQDTAFGGRTPGPMEIDPRLVPRSPTDAQQSGDNTFTRDAPEWRQWHTPPLTAANDNLPRVVALSGVAGSGKSTVASHLIKRYGYTRLKFAGPLKAMCRAIGMTDAMIEGGEKELPVSWLSGRSPRYFMQRLGTDFGRDLIGPDLWVGLFQKAANDVLAAGGRVVVDDCRFDNEADTVRAMGGVVLKLEGRGGIGASHVSERITERVDATVPNDGSIDDLRRRAVEALSR